MNQTTKNIIKKFIRLLPKNESELNECLRRMFKGTGKPIPSKSELIKAYHELVASGKLKRSPLLEHVLRKRSVRTLSGVTIVTVLTKPYFCPGKCVYCPNEPGMPKSYISDEPAAARALALRFDPYAQTIERIRTLQKNGHPTDKIELIVKGGSWNAYPLSYQHWFILSCFQAANETNNKKQIAEKDIKIIKKRLADAQQKNETAKHRIIGLTLETRPDLINENSLKEMRQLGCTRVELGVQTIDDKILKLIKRGHSAAETARATKLLKNYGFKVDYHLMPQLPGSTPAKDAKMLAEIFANSDYRPDMIKIYPCIAVRKSPLYKWIKSKKFKPYSDKKLIELLINFKSSVPRYVRISRLIRDIPGHHIVAGNKMTNLRQVIQSEMALRGLKCNCLRCREIGRKNANSLRHKNTVTQKPKLYIEKYKANEGTEYFLSFEDANREFIFAFCRLRIDKAGIYPAFIRELHTYGPALEIGGRSRRASQHKGLGAKLVAEVEKICKKNKITKLAVISGVGVRDYYRKLSYKLDNSYLVKSL